MYIILYIIGLLPGLVGINDHDFHLSKTDIHFKSDKQAIQFTIHMFIDDFEKAIETKDSVLLKLFTEKESPLSDSLSEIYLLEKLKVEIDGQAHNPSYLGMELSDDLSAIWCYLEILNVQDMDELFISNQILLELFDDQKNIVNIKVDNKLAEFLILDDKNYKKSIRI